MIFRLTAVFVLTSAAAGVARALTPSPTFDGAPENPADVHKSGAAHVGDTSARREELRAEAAARELGNLTNNRSTAPPAPPQEKKSNGFLDYFFGPQFCAAIVTGVGLGAALGVMAAVATANPLIGLAVFAIGALLFGALFNFLK